NLDGVFALATYSTSAFGPNSAYFGIRRVPYSVDFTKNALTFKHIADGVALPAVPTQPGGPNSEVHNAGEIWTTMLWEGYVAMQKTRVRRDSFDDVRRRMADYVVAGLEMTPTDATYTEQRDAIRVPPPPRRPPRRGAMMTTTTTTETATIGRAAVPICLRSPRRLPGAARAP